METSPQDKRTEAPSAISGTEIEFRSHVGTSQHFEEGNGASSGTGVPTVSAHDTSIGAKYKLRSPAELPISRSPCNLTIPHGLSPTSFLESPILLSNIKAEPSPTTGTFSLSKLMQGSSEVAAVSMARNGSTITALDQAKSNGFEFQFDTGGTAATGPPVSMASPGFKLQRNDSPKEISHENLPEKREMPLSKEISAPGMLISSSNPTTAVDSALWNHKGQQNRGIQLSYADNKDVTSSVPTERSLDDGYNWRKYGQKLVKGSEFPRSYYKCTFPNCEVKKIFERSPDGQIKEIVYKGSHDHPKPQPNRRLNAGALMSAQEEKLDRDQLLCVQEDNSNAHISNMELSSTPVLSPQQENEDGPDATLQLQCVNDEVDDDDPFSKKRKLDGAMDETLIVKPIREPRVVVQTVSEVDILDDGYRWRKYGQKVVRGNPNPRSYYKCTSGGCSVRKHVERASHDPKAVITTYEGKHNHDVPTARTSSHEMAGPPRMNGIPHVRSDENDPGSFNHGVGISYMQSITPMEGSRSWSLNLFRPNLQSTFPVE